MADEQPSGTGTPAEQQSTGGAIPEARRAPAVLPAGIRWWEACGGWASRYSLGTF
jgi:hypothetical protein